jgi:hypothetical protein
MAEREKINEERTGISQESDRPIKTFVYVIEIYPVSNISVFIGSQSKAGNKTQQMHLAVIITIDQNEIAMKCVNRKW